MKRNNKGFTLAELLIVVAVIAVLVAVAIPTFGSQLEKARQATDQANLRDVYAAAKLLVLNQEDTENDLKLSNTSETGDYGFWCDPDTGVFTKAANDTETVSAAETRGVVVSKGKAQTSTLVSNAGLPSGVTYTSTTTDNPGTLPTNAKAILVSFHYDKDALLWTLTDVTYKANGKATAAFSLSAENGEYEIPDSATDSMTLDLGSLITVKLGETAVTDNAKFSVEAKTVPDGETGVAYAAISDKAKGDAKLTAKLPANYSNDIVVKVTVKYTDEDDGNKLYTDTVNVTFKGKAATP